jgi:hypothetical protein
LLAPPQLDILQQHLQFPSISKLFVTFRRLGSAQAVTISGSQTDWIRLTVSAVLSSDDNISVRHNTTLQYEKASDMRSSTRKDSPPPAAAAAATTAAAAPSTRVSRRVGSISPRDQQSTDDHQELVERPYDLTPIQKKPKKQTKFALDPWKNENKLEHDQADGLVKEPE